MKSYGFTPVIVPAAAVMSMHGDAEYLPVDAVGPAIQILFEALKETAASRLTPWPEWSRSSSSWVSRSTSAG